MSLADRVNKTHGSSCFWRYQFEIAHAGSALERIGKSSLSHVIVSDTIPIQADPANELAQKAMKEKIKVLKWLCITSPMPLYICGLFLNYVPKICRKTGAPSLGVPMKRSHGTCKKYCFCFEYSIPCTMHTSNVLWDSTHFTRRKAQTRNVYRATIGLSRGEILVVTAQTNSEAYTDSEE
jgi:hypothetical protein